MYSIHLACSSVSSRPAMTRSTACVDPLLGGQQRRRVDGGVLDHRDDVDERLVVGGIEGALQVGLGEVLGRLA